ncbi:putative competence-damage inducible protein [Robertmurraya siralis]|uniref:Putative competence-damage inducible protein n=1 Tax=Robertmurraya siralis TaxID=77777 RepID=A0A919WGQ0_9BACI|nr:competence/damage-inducible protein A [Robertmurraya siralis]PAE21459.1 competence/damage-inducible protein A [Bacillus sp. 7504-2]GIN61600.1 putative competence-damage inducible protein [Robertmurraya siralis]
MNAEIIAVGSELLLGQIVNTNAQFLSKQLANIGVNVYYHTVVGDNPERLKGALEIAESRADLIILTGGLGPTKDDLTKETIASHLGKKLVHDEVALSSIEQYFQTINRVMTDNNRKQALVLEGAAVLPNDHGMAPGMVVTVNERSYMLLPGPPKELEPMFSQYGEKEILKLQPINDKIVSRVLRFFGIGESMLETEIDDLIDGQQNPTIAPLAADGEVTLRLTAKAKNEELAHQLIDKTEQQILARVGEYFYGYDSTSLMNELFQELDARNLTIACAESLTGGLFQQEITSISGAGDVFKGGVVCYATEVKKHVLNVKKETTETYGAVSAACALELAENVRSLIQADIGISFTGVAGPAKQEGKPVGMVFIGISIKGREPKYEQLQLAGTREGIRLRTIKHGCHFLLNSLKE